ncbi:hypothetical protein WN943_022950 [Citrus x changshan-huyou]
MTDSLSISISSSLFNWPLLPSYSFSDSESVLARRIGGIFNNLSIPFNKVKAKSAFYKASNLVSVGDLRLSFAIKRRLIEAIAGAEDQHWFKCLSHKRKRSLKYIYAGMMQEKLILEDWKDLWHPKLAGRISMVNSARKVIGSVLKYMGGSYNTNDIDLQVVVKGDSRCNQMDPGKFNKVLVRLFDSTQYLKAFGIGDEWVAVGWSSDVLPAVKCMSNVAVVVPMSAIPAASRLGTNQIGGRVRGPSPLVHQWIEFCLQIARALPFKQEVIPGASPSALESTLIRLLEELLNGKPSLDANLFAGVPPPEILARCEFLEPLSEATLSDYEWLVVNLQTPAPDVLKWLKFLRFYEKRKTSACLNKVVDNLAKVKKKDHGAYATYFFIVVASVVEVSSFKVVYVHAFSLLKYRKSKN